MTIADTLLWLCSIPSPTGHEEDICNAIEQHFQSNHADLVMRRHGDSLVVELCPPVQGWNVALAGHLDTVRTEHDGPPRVEGDRVYGPGASDMKSGLALMIELAALVRGEPRPIGVSLVFYAGEEGAYYDNELARVLRDDPTIAGANFAICLEPSDNTLQLGCAGNIHAQVTFEGRTAHSARPWQGENAIQKAAPLLHEIALLQPQYTEVEGLQYATVTSVTMAEGGRGRNVVPDRFVINLNHRFCPGLTPDEAMQTLESLVAARGAIEFVDVAPAAMPNRHHPLTEALVAAGVKEVQSKQAWTDVARFVAKGIAAVNFGPGVQSQAHQRNEWTRVSQLQQGLEMVVRWLEGLR
jgi:succinyl-diaminopimelate desuccinylase